MRKENRPECIILAGVNGAGKSTLFYKYVKEEGLVFVNADNIAKALNGKNNAQASIQAISCWCFWC